MLCSALDSPVQLLPNPKEAEADPWLLQNSKATIRNRVLKRSGHLCHLVFVSLHQTNNLTGQKKTSTTSWLLKVIGVDDLRSSWSSWVYTLVSFLL